MKSSQCFQRLQIARYVDYAHEHKQRKRHKLNHTLSYAPKINQTSKCQSERTLNQPWKKESPQKIKPSDITINCEEDLNVLKNKYKVGHLLNKSKRILKEENEVLQENINNMSPRIQSWNRSHQRNFYESRTNSEERMQLKKRILSQQNMRIKRKLDKTPPKIDDKCNLLSIHRKSPRELIKKFIKLKVNEDIVKKNFEVVDKIENTHPKVESWTNVKKLHQLVKAKKDRIYNKTVINKTLTLMKNKIDKNEKKFQKEKRKHYKSDLQIVKQFQ